MTGSNAAASGPGLTLYVAAFIPEAAAADLPATVVEIGKKSIVDGLGLALSGSVATSGALVRRYLIRRLGWRPSGEGGHRSAPIV
jgi:hypothetical protein